VISVARLKTVPQIIAENKKIALYEMDFQENYLQLPTSIIISWKKKKNT
jgi:hypothetical protein